MLFQNISDLSGCWFMVDVNLLIVNEVHINNKHENPFHWGAPPCMCHGQNMFASHTLG